MRQVAWNGLRTINFLYGLHFWDPSTSLIINNIFKLLFQKQPIYLQLRQQ